MTLGVGIIGCGAVSEFHMRAVHAHVDCRLVACADVRAEMATRRAEQFGVRQTYSDADELINDKHVDLVAVCTPPKWHAELALEALRLGKHVVVEKPLAMNLSEADAIVRAIAGTDLIVGVALVHRYLPSYQSARVLVKGGALGQMQWVHLALGRDMKNDSRFLTESRDPRRWLSDSKIAGGGILMSSSIHFLSAVSYVLGEPSARTVVAHLRQLHPSAFDRVEDDVELQIEWNNGVHFVHRESWVVQMPYRAEMVGEAGHLLIEGDDCLQLALRGDFALPLPSHHQNLLGTPGEDRAAHSDPHVEMMFHGFWSDMVDSVRRRLHVPRLPSVHHARNMQAIIAMAYDSPSYGTPRRVDWLPIDVRQPA